MSEPTRYRYPSRPHWDQICSWVNDPAGHAVLLRSVGLWEYGPDAGPNLLIFVDDAAAGFLTDQVRQEIEIALHENPEGIVIRAVVWQVGDRRASTRSGNP